MKKKEIPLIKEYRIEKLFQVLKCFEAHPFNRDALRDCMLRLYEGKDEKSIFRGMVIPSTRHLGLIMGYEEELRLSANGYLIVNARKISEEEGLRAFRTILAEIDNATLKILKIITKTGIGLEDLRTKLISKVDAPSIRQAKERVNHWISMLISTGLLVEKEDIVEISQKALTQVEVDLDVSAKKKRFKETFFSAYELIFKKQDNVPIVDIADLRTEVAAVYYTRDHLIVTEDQFDDLLREGIPLATEEYIISLGRSMGAEEQLFRYEDNYYRTVSIRFLNKGGLT